MPKFKNPIIFHAICWLLLCILCLSVNAQKIPNVQQGSLRAPLTVKTDGKLTEWGKQLQAYNNSTGVFYTIANSNDKLYLTLLAKDASSIKKILLGGITFTINQTGKSSDKERMSITFPLLKMAEVSSLNIKFNEPAFAIDAAGKARQTDSIAMLLNTDLATKAKDIKVEGISQIADKLISVYNDEDIRASLRFDSEKYLVYELAVPLKYLGLSIANQPKFHYNLMLNGLDKSNTVVYPNGNAMQILSVSTIPKGLTTGASNGTMNYNYPTDFWGEYTLIK
jgi:hypothetical protein